MVFLFWLFMFFFFFLMLFVVCLFPNNCFSLRCLFGFSDGDGPLDGRHAGGASLIQKEKVFIFELGECI